MAHKMFKPYSFLMYLLALIAFFFIGVSYAGLADAGKNQGLAGGAIVFGYGVVGAGIGLIIALFTIGKATKKVAIRINIVLFIVIIAFYIFYHLKYLDAQNTKAKENQKIEKPLNE